MLDLINNNIFLLLSFIAICGFIGSFLFKRFHLPVITGQIFIGVLLGPSFLHIIGHEIEQKFLPITSFAVALIAITVGTHLNFNRLHNSYHRILTIAAMEASFAFLFVFSAFYFFNPLELVDPYHLPFALIIASVASATSPASALHVIKEKYAKGIVVKTLIAVIAVDNIICLCLFEFFRAVSKSVLLNENLLYSFSLGILGVLLAISFAIAIAFLLHFFGKKLKINYKKNELEFFSGALLSFLFIAIMLLDGLCSFLTDFFQGNGWGIYLSPILAHLVLGLTLANISSLKDDFIKQFSHIENFIFICFFVLAGTHLDINNVSTIFILPIITYLACLGGGKFLGAYWGAKLIRAPKKLVDNIGGMLFVQAGITIALIWVVASEPIFKPIANELITIVLTCVVITELVGTVLIAKAIDRVKETNKNKNRLIDFIEEEFILPVLFSHNRWEAIDALSHFMSKTHKLEISEEQLKNSIVEREKLTATGIGSGIAVPHAKIELSDTNSIQGVFAIADPPIDFKSPDGPAKYIILLITPLNNEEKHVEVISNIAKLLRTPDIVHALDKAKTSAEIYDIIYSEQAENYNYFL